jgi:hypothetical protein
MWQPSLISEDSHFGRADGFQGCSQSNQEFVILIDLILQKAEV